MSDSVGSSIKGATMSGPESINGTYGSSVNLRVRSRCFALLRLFFCFLSFPYHFYRLPDAKVFTDRAIQIINSHNASEPLYMYIAYHNPHDACTADRFKNGLNAPLATVNM
jgi:hypothetical protein